VSGMMTPSACLYINVLSRGCSSLVCGYADDRTDANMMSLYVSCVKWCVLYAHVSTHTHSQTDTQIESLSSIIFRCQITRHTQYSPAISCLERFTKVLICNSPNGLCNVCYSGLCDLHVT